MSFQLFMLSSVYSISALKFLEHRFFASLGRFIPRYFIISVVIVTRIAFLISLYDTLLLGCRNVADFLYINIVSGNFTEFINEFSHFLACVLRVFHV